MDLSIAPLENLIEETINYKNSICEKFDVITSKTSSTEHFYLKLRKNQITRNKLKIFSQSGKSPTVWLGKLLQNTKVLGQSCSLLKEKFWLDKDFLQSLLIGEEKNIIFIANNDLSGISQESLLEFAKFCLNGRNVLLVIWDADNHHWSMLSTVTCIAADFYFPAHMERISYFQSLNPFVPEVMPLGSCQWSVDLLQNHASLIKNQNRNPGPWGRHQYYSRFETRNAIVKTVGQKHPDVGFISNSERVSDPLESLKQWTNYKTHFCTCVGGDMPYRVFDGIITGGVVIIPVELRAYFSMFKLTQSRVVYYEAADIFDTERLIHKAAHAFDTNTLEQEDLNKLFDEFHMSGFGQKILKHVIESIRPS